jgi:hypothetical protein
MQKMSSSIHIAQGQNGYLAHNSRETKTVNSIFTDEQNFCSSPAKESFKIFRDELAVRSQIFTERTGKKVQAKTLTHLSAVVNLTEKHGSADVKKICDYLESRLDTKVFQYAIHRDEGHIADDGKPVKNYHAHIEFLGLDSEGASVRKKLTRAVLSDLQTEVAKVLGMERGRNFNQEWTKFKSGELQERPLKTRRLDTYEFKQAKALEQTARLATVKEVELGYKAEREALKQSGQATQKDYQDLKKEFDAFKELAKAKDLTVETLELRLSEAKNTLNSFAKQTTKLYKSVTQDNVQAPTDSRFFDYVAEEREALKEKLAAAELRAELQAAREKVIEKQLSQALQSKKEVEAVNHTLLSEKNDLRASQTALIAENTELKVEVSKWKEAFNKLAKALKDITKCDKVNLAMDKIKEKFNQLISKVETAEEFKKGFEKRQVHTTTAKIRAEVRASNDPKELKEAKEVVIDEYERERFKQMCPIANEEQLEEFRLINRGLAPKAKEPTLDEYVQKFDQQKSRDRGYER